MAKVTKGFSGADLTEICQRACKLAIRECIEKDIAMEKRRAEQPDLDEEMEDCDIEEVKDELPIHAQGAYPNALS